MALQHLVFHRIQKWQEDGEVSLKLRNEAHAIGADAESLFNTLRKTFNGKAGKNYGCFQDDYASFPVSRWLQECLDEKIPFARFSQLVMERLQQALQEAPVCLDGSVMLALDQRPEGHDLYFFLIPEASSFQLTNDLELTLTEHLDPAHLDIAARIELDAWKGKHRSDSYITTLVGGGAKARAEVVLNTLGFVSAIDIKEETNTFLQAVEQFSAQLPQEEEPQYRKRVYDYCVEQEQFGEPVELETLSRLIDEKNPQAFAEFARNQETPLSDEIRPDRRRLRSLVKFSGRAKGVTLSFSSDAIDQTVIYDPESGSLTIRELPATLKQQLNRYLKRQQGE